MSSLPSPGGLFSRSCAVTDAGWKTGRLSLSSRMVTVRLAVLFSPPMSRATSVNSSRGSGKASRSITPPGFTEMMPGEAEEPSDRPHICLVALDWGQGPAEPPHLSCC